MLYYNIYCLNTPLEIVVHKVSLNQTGQCQSGQALRGANNLSRQELALCWLFMLEMQVLSGNIRPSKEWKVNNGREEKVFAK